MKKVFGMLWLAAWRWSCMRGLIDSRPRPLCRDEWEQSQEICEGNGGSGIPAENACEG